MAVRPFRRRILILPLAALVITALVVYRLQRGERPQPVISERSETSQPAPRVPALLTDQHRNTVKLERYYGRSELVLVFFDAAVGADRDPYLSRLRDCYERLEAAGIQPVGISRATRYENLQAEERAGRPFPFPLLTDIHPDRPGAPPAHEQFGLFDSQTDSTRTGVFLIDRAGRTTWEAGFPRPLKDPESAIESLCRGEWPELSAK